MRGLSAGEGRSPVAPRGEVEEKEALLLGERGVAHPAGFLHEVEAVEVAACALLHEADVASGVDLPGESEDDSGGDASDVCGRLLGRHLEACQEEDHSGGHSQFAERECADEGHAHLFAGLGDEGGADHGKSGSRGADEAGIVDAGEEGAEDDIADSSGDAAGEIDSCHLLPSGNLGEERSEPCEPQTVDQQMPEVDVGEHVGEEGRGELCCRGGVGGECQPCHKALHATPVGGHDEPCGFEDGEDGHVCDDETDGSFHFSGD